MELRLPELPACPSDLGETERAHRKDILRAMLREAGYEPTGLHQPLTNEVAEVLWPFPVKQVVQPEPRQFRIVFDRPLTGHEAFELATLFEGAVEAEYHDDVQGVSYAEVAWLPQ